MTAQMINDTGSNALNLFYHEARILALGIPVPLHQVFLETTEDARRNTTVVEVQITGRNGAPLTEWMLEIAALIHPPANVCLVNQCGLGCPLLQPCANTISHCMSRGRRLD